MGLFNFLNKEKKAAACKNILGMVLLEETNSLNIQKLVSELRDHWKLQVDDKEATDEASVLEINGYKIALVSINVPIPGDELETTANYSYLWENAQQETSKHQGHIIVSIINAGKDPVEENMLFTKIVSSVLNQSRSIGIYMGGRTLLLEKNFYQAQLEEAAAEHLPLLNWIYFGIKTEELTNSMYTYGLADFGKKEIEMVDSDRSVEELNEMMLNLVNYILVSDVILNDGETIGFTEDQKLKINISKGVFIDSKTVKVKF